MKEDIFQVLYTRRLVVLLETDPQTNVYQQVVLNASQFKSVSDSIADTFPKGDMQGLKKGHTSHYLNLSSEEYTLPSEIKDIHYDVPV